MPLKGVLRWRGARAEVECRLPLGSLIFLAAWLVGWTVAATMLVSQDDPLLGVGFLVGGWAFTGALSWFSLWFERRRARRIVAELDGALATAA